MKSNHLNLLLYWNCKKYKSCMLPSSSLNPAQTSAYGFIKCLSQQYWIVKQRKEVPAQQLYSQRIKITKRWYILLNTGIILLLKNYENYHMGRHEDMKFQQRPSRCAAAGFPANQTTAEWDHACRRCRTGSHASLLPWASMQPAHDGEDCLVRKKVDFY